MAEHATYKLPQAAWRLSFTPEVLQLLCKHAQLGRLSRESVGQLYARDLTANTVVIAKATRLKATYARWARVRFDVHQAMRERERLFEDGWHCVGFWHTHPEPSPTPSSEDRAMARDHARAALSVTNGMVFAIVGTAPLPAGLGVWFDDGVSLDELAPQSAPLDSAVAMSDKAAPHRLRVNVDG